MAKFTNDKEVKEVKKVGLTINVFKKDDVIDEVTTGTHLGTGTLELNDDSGLYEGFSHFRPNSKVPLTLDVAEFGEPSVTEEVTEGMHDVDAKFDALAHLDEIEKVDALSVEEKQKLSSIGYLELRQIGIDSHDHKPPTTPLEEAAIAILQHDDLPGMELAHNTKPGVGPVVDAVVTLEVGEHEFTEESAGFIAEIKPCADGRTLYQYNWTNAKSTVLDEPK
jgi:hypothetical protein